MESKGSEFDCLDTADLGRRRSIKWSLHPDDVLAAWVADMDFGIAPPIRDAVQHVLDTDDLGYPGSDLRDAVRQAFVDRMADRHGWVVDIDDTWLLTTVVQGLHVGLSLFADPGEGVVVQTPIYPPFLEAISKSGQRMVSAPLGRDGDRYVVDPDLFEGSLDEGTTVLMLCNPHNPTGRAFTRSELESIADIVERHDLMVIADEIHQDLLYPGSSHTVFASLGPAVAERTITLSSASKAFNLAGNRCAVVHLGSPEIRARFEAMTHRLFGEVSLVGHVATLAAWTDPASARWLNELVAYLDGNRRWLDEALKTRLPAARHSPPDGTYLAWVDLSAYGLGDDPSARLLDEGRVALGRGLDFGPGGEGHVRVNMATSRHILEQVVDRIVSVVGNGAGV